MSTLVNKTHFDGVNFRYLSQNTEDVDIDSFIDEAEEFDIVPFIGRALYQDLITTYPDAGIYSDLVEGTTYLDCNGDTIKMPGLRKAIQYYAFARYTAENDLQSTPTGFVIKETDFHSRPSQKALQSRIDGIKAMGKSILEQVQAFLIEKKDTYPLYKNTTGSNRGGVTITPVDRRERISKNYFTGKQYE